MTAVRGKQHAVSGEQWAALRPGYYPGLGFRYSGCTIGNINDNDINDKTGRQG